jgi:23S rRNA (pseudouridine1915-N3)-methyltransferase
MKVSLIYIGKTNQNFVKDGFEIFAKRLKHYTKFQEILIEDVKNAGKLPKDELKKLEGEKLLSKVNNTDFLVLLDEKGKSFQSVLFAKWLEQKAVQGTQHIIFAVGGAFGFSEKVYERADFSLRLSDMTFSHQLIRLIFAEQLYRAYTIINNEPYHND